VAQVHERLVQQFPQNLLVKPHQSFAADYSPLHLGSSDYSLRGETCFSFTSEAQTTLRECNGQMVVEKGCESCRKWQEHYYWEHMDVTKIRFFKPMTGGDFAKGIVSVRSPHYPIKTSSECLFCVLAYVVSERSHENFC
jgi:hypothetical protein